MFLRCRRDVQSPTGPESWVDARTTNSAEDLGPDRSLCARQQAPSGNSPFLSAGAPIVFVRPSSRSALWDQLELKPGFVPDRAYLDRSYSPDWMMVRDGCRNQSATAR